MHFATLRSCLDLCPPQSLTMPINCLVSGEAFSAHAYTGLCSFSAGLLMGNYVFIEYVMFKLTVCKCVWSAAHICFAEL